MNPPLCSISRASRTLSLYIFLWILVSGFWTLPASAQTNGIDQDLNFVTPSTGGKFIEWYGKTGRSYFVQVSDPSDHLNKWNWAPVIELGNNQSISYEVDCTADKGFFRLQYADQTDTDPDNADFDGDGLTNLEEITPYTRPGARAARSIIGGPPPANTIQTNPLDPDTDHDGLGDKWERDNGLDPTDNGTVDPNNGANGDPDGDGVSNLAEQAHGTDPNNSDTDGDGLLDKWELDHNLDPIDDGSNNSDNGSSGDPDHDGFSNPLEQSGGTDPNDPDSHPPGTPLPGGTPLLVGEQVTIYGTRWGFTGFQNSAKRYLQRVNHIVSTDPDNDGDGGDRTTTETIDDLRTGASSSTSIGSGGSDYGNAWTIASDVSRNRNGTDDDGSGETSTASETLFTEYTIPVFIANVESWLPAYQNHFTTNTSIASIALTPITGNPEPATEYTITKLHYKWQVNAAPGQVVNWLEVFTPADGTTPVAISKSWSPTATDTESSVYEIDPTIRNGKKNGEYSLLPVDLDIEYNSQAGIKELEDSKEDTGDGGYISLKSQTHQGEDITPTTYLVIRPTTGLPNDSKVRLKFNSGDRYKVSKNLLGTDLVVSEVTEFPAGQETRLYLVGETKSQSQGGENLTMQIKVGGSWVDGDSLKATVVQTQFQIDLRVFIPYNWVNIPLHPSVAGGDKRSYDPSLSGTYRVSQKAILNLYKEWVPEIENRMIDNGKSAGITYHYSTSDVTNFNSGAKHSEDTTVKPSYVNSGAIPSDSGIADLSGVEVTVLSSLSNDNRVTVEFEGEAAEPILPVAAPINWRFSVGISKTNPLNPSFSLEGAHDGFPAYEIYVNCKHPKFLHTEVLTWKPPLSADVWELVGGLDNFVGPLTGNINQ